MKEDWTLFEGTPFGRRRRSEPRVTLNVLGQICMNAIAYETLGAPQAVEMMYDGNRRLIGVRACDARKRHAFKVSSWGNSSYKRILAAAFCQHFRLKWDSTLQFEKIDLEREGMMILDLNCVSRVTRGAR